MTKAVPDRAAWLTLDEMEEVILNAILHLPVRWDGMPRYIAEKIAKASAEKALIEKMLIIPNMNQRRVEMEFIGFQKMPRLSRECIITEKIDGTNAQIFIADDCETMLIGSRTRWITPQNDNYGFARWCEANRDQLLLLGPGRHFGEWWGNGVQRGYGIKEKRFSLFNALRWTEENAPSCVGVVPVLYRGIFTTDAVESCLQHLRDGGSVASPGFMKPEKVIAFHIAGGFGFKKTIESDEIPKALQGA